MLLFIQCIGCEINNLFVNKADGGRLRTLNTFRVRKTRLPKRINCAINVSTSWYIECHGKQESLEGNTNDFRFNVPGGKREYHLKVRTILSLEDTKNGCFCC